MMLTTKGAVNKTTLLFIADATTGLGLTGLVFNTASLVASYARPGAVRTAILLATQTVTGAHTDGGFVEVDATNMPGVYRLDVPDAAFSAGVDEVYIYIHGAADMAPVAQRVQLSAINIQNAASAGMTNLNAASSTLATSDALSTAQSFLTAMLPLVGTTDTNASAIRVVADKLDTSIELDGAVYRLTANALEQSPATSISPTDWQRLARVLYGGGTSVIFAAVSGSGSGLSPHDPTDFEDACSTAVDGDVIMVLPGTHTLAANTSIADGVRIKGFGANNTRITRVTTTNAPVIAIGSNNIIEDVQIDNIGATIGQPVGSLSRLIYNTVFRRCVSRSAVDTFVLLTGPTPGRHKVLFQDCDFDSDWDNFASGAGTLADVTFERCRMFARSQAARSIYILNIEANTGAIRVYCKDCLFVKRSAGSEGGAIDIRGGNTEVRLSGCTVEASELGETASLSFRVADGAKVILDAATVFDRDKVTLANGGQLVRTIPESFETLAIADSAVASNTTRVAGSAVSGVADFKADVSGLATAADLTAVDAVVDGIKAVTDDLATTLEDSATPGVKRFKEPTLEEAPAGEATVNAQDIRDAMKLAPSAGAAAAGSIDAKLDSVDSPAGSGDTAWPVTVNDLNGDPIANAQVWIRATASQSGQVLASGYTNDAGVVTFQLDAGVTYYAWRSADGFNFSNPQPFTVTA